MESMAARLRVLVAVFSGLFGVWAVFARFRLLLRSEIQEHAASKTDLARLEAKVDTILELNFAAKRKRR